MPPIEVDGVWAAIVLVVWGVLKYGGDFMRSRNGKAPAMRKDIDALKTEQTLQRKQLYTLQRTLRTHTGQLKDIWDHVTKPSEPPDA